MQDNTPILIGAGQAVDSVPEDLTQASSHADMAGRAAQAALQDAGIDGALIDWLACVRTFSDSSPAYTCPFGGPDKFPRAIAARIDAAPAQAIYGVIGGQSPQSFVAEAAQALSSGDIKFALIAGGEALANMRAAQRSGTTLDWSETYLGDWTDRGWFGGPMIVSQTEIAHGLMDAMPYYGFIETARRIRAGRSVADHRDYMAKLIAPMSGVAAQNPYSMSNVTTDEIEFADIYSCFPCVVDQAATQLNRKDKGPEKGMTLTGGLPFFGGPGNNYTLHGICEVIAACRRAPGSIGLAHGNGGWMSKQAVGIYSCEWKDSDVFADKGKIAKAIAAQPAPGQTAEPSGAATMESYVVHHKRGVPTGATLIGQLDDETRFYAQLQDIDQPELKALADGKMDGAALKVVAGLPANKAWFV